MKFIFGLLFLTQITIAGTPGGEFIEQMIESRPEFQKYLGNRKITEWDSKNVVASWVKGYIDLAFRENNTLIVFDPNEPSGTHLCEYSTILKPDGGEYILIRVAIQKKQRFEDTFFSLISSLMKARNDDQIQKLKKDFFAGRPVDPNEISDEFMRINHLVLYSIFLLRRDEFKDWGKEHRLFSENSVWDSVSEKDYSKWMIDPESSGTRRRIQRQVDSSYQAWKVALDRRLKSR